MSRCKEIEPVTANKLLDKFITARNVYDASIDEIVCCLGISEQHAMKMMGDRSLDDAKRIIDLCEQNRVSILTKEDKKYIDNAKKLLEYRPDQSMEYLDLSQKYGKI